MKTLQPFHLGSTIVSATALSLLTSMLPFTPMAAPPAKEKFVVQATRTAIAFPPKPAGATDTLTVSSPTVLVDETLAARLGGPALVKMAVPSLENMLNNSGRFTVLLDREAPYKIKATITSLKISQNSAKKSAAAADVFKTLIPKLAGKNKIDPELAGLMTADWSKDEVVMNVECAITIQLLDKDSRLIVGNTGVVSRETTTAAIRGELGGITFGNGLVSGAGATPATSTDLDVPGKLIELAAYESLKQSLSAIDRELLQRKAVTSKEQPPASPPSGSNGSPAGEAKTTDGKSKFCGECGQTVGAANKFCTGCGKPLGK